MPIGAISGGGPLPGRENIEALLPANAEVGAVPGVSTFPRGIVGIRTSDSRAGITTSAMNGGTSACIRGVATKPTNGTCSATVINITSGVGRICGNNGACRSIGNSSGSGFLILIDGPAGLPDGSSGTSEIVGGDFLGWFGAMVCS